MLTNRPFETYSGSNTSQNYNFDYPNMPSTSSNPPSASAYPTYGNEMTNYNQNDGKNMSNYQSLSLNGNSPTGFGDTQKVNVMLDGLKNLYKKKIRPLEEAYSFDSFSSSPCLNDVDIEAKPFVLLLGQYSTGKTSFIEYLLGKTYPGAHIGPEPTTDRFVAVMGGNYEQVIPGNAAAVSGELPFNGLSRFGTNFLSKFQVSQTQSPLLDGITFIDTPGVLSGEKQRLGRSYDFVQVIRWFADRSDLILLLFDAAKLDISDEFKSVIHALKGNDDKIRVILNKADSVTGQQLLRVYGAMMWSLGKVVTTPEVPRVYLGSFWSTPLRTPETKMLLAAEQSDLMRDLSELPKNAAIRRLNEIVKRARYARVHAYIVSHLRKSLPAVFGKSAKQEQLIDNLDQEFQKIMLTYKLPPGDFPDASRYKEHLRLHKIKKFDKLNPKLMNALDEVLAVDLPALMRESGASGFHNVSMNMGPPPALPNRSQQSPVFSSSIEELG